MLHANFRSRTALALSCSVVACVAGSACAPEDGGTASFTTRASIGQIFVTHAQPGQELAVFDGAGKQVQTGRADTLGSLIFRRLPPGGGYVVRVPGSEPPQYSAALEVRAAEGSLPQPSFYAGQKLLPGFGYITTRDGTTLSAYITLPGPVEGGPYPTVVNYSGYSPSKPGKPLGNFDFLCGDFPTLCDAPDDPSGLIASLFGYATVSVNLRGTGCSGGAYDFFETLQVLDGYDVIEAVAAQPWVLHHKVGMTGLSYPGISQLFVAQSRPPSLAAITPLSVIGNTATTLAPGGILNNGFATTWIDRVLDKAAPYGQGWEKDRVAAGDSNCYENQLLHGQRVDNVAQARNTPFYDPALVDPLNPTLFVGRIEVPVFLAGSFQDEQTGPFFTTLLDRFTSSKQARFTVQNGVHPDSFAPAILAEWQAFLDLYVWRRVPQINPRFRSLAPLLFGQVFGADLPLPEDRFAMYKSYDEALAAYQREPALRAIFESGWGAPSDPGAPKGTFERAFSGWPIKETQVRRYFLHPGGKLREGLAAEGEAASAFRLDPAAGERTVLAPGGDVFDKLPKYDYRALRPGYAAVFETEAMSQPMTLLGNGSADLFIKSSADDADLQVTVTEVRPDGQEVYVQSGWLRASQRKLGPDSTALFPVPTHLQGDAAALRPGEWTPVRVPIAAFGHVFRTGSRLRFTVDTPGDVRAEWRFQLKTFPGEVTHTVGHSANHPSSVALPLVPVGTVPDGAPRCPSLRGQPCRPYAAYTNTPG